MTAQPPELDTFLAVPALRTLDAVQHAIEGLDFASAAAALFARAKHGESCPIGLAGQIVPHLANPSAAALLVLLSDGDRADAVATLLEADGFPDDELGVLAAIACALAVLALDPFARARLAVETRVLTRTTRSTGSPALRVALRALADALGDDTASRAMAGVTGPPPPGIANAGAMARMPRAELLAMLDAVTPSVAAARPALAPRVRRRDEPCWCGPTSGTPRRHAHDAAAGGGHHTDAGGDTGPPRDTGDASAARDNARSDRARDPSADAPDTDEERRDERVARGLTAPDVRRVPLAELARIGFAHLGDAPLVTAFHRLLDRRVLGAAERALHALVARAHLSREARDGARLCFSVRAVRAWRLEPALDQLDQIRTPRFAAMRDALTAAIAIAQRSPGALDRLIELSERALGDPRAPLLAPLAETLGALVPSLGLLIARAAVASDLDAPARERMLLVAEEAHARLPQAVTPP